MNWYVAYPVIASSILIDASCQIKPTTTASHRTATIRSVIPRNTIQHILERNSQLSTVRDAYEEIQLQTLSFSRPSRALRTSPRSLSVTLGNMEHPLSACAAVLFFFQLAMSKKNRSWAPPFAIWMIVLRGSGVPPYFKAYFSRKQPLHSLEMDAGLVHSFSNIVVASLNHT